MNGRAFLDTNIFVYAAGGEGGRKARIADQLIEGAIHRGSGVISYQVVQEFLNVALGKFATPFSVEQARMYIGATFRPMFAVQSSLGLCSDALEICFRYQLSWYDSLIVAAASEANCTVLYTEDMQHGATFDGVRIEDPFRTQKKV
jgi:predicted nucleic acid-binding protein